MNMVKQEIIPGSQRDTEFCRVLAGTRKLCRLGNGLWAVACGALVLLGLGLAGCSTGHPQAGPKSVSIQIVFPPGRGLNDIASASTNSEVQRVLQVMDQALEKDGFTRTTPPPTSESSFSIFVNGHNVTNTFTVINTNILAVYIPKKPGYGPSVLLNHGQLSVEVFDYGNDRPYTDRTSKLLRAALTKEFGKTNIQVTETGG